jgi:hypothetical protein
MGLNDASILDSISPKGEDFNVNDISSYTPSDMSPQQKESFNNMYSPSTGPLPVSTYYPGINHNIGVGTYSGSQIGSATLFAPGGDLVPLGLLDARDLAMKQAAMKKAKDLEDFNKQYQSPTTKHTAVQKSLTDSYFDGLNKWIGNATQKAGGDQATAINMLKNDVGFQRWNKGMQDRAKMQDQGVEIAAQLQSAEKDENFVLSPETRNAMKSFLSGEYAGADPFSKEGTQFTKNFISMKANYDLDKAVNDSLTKAIPNLEQLPPTFQGRGKNELATFLEKEYFTPEQKKSIAHDIFMEKFQGTGITEDQVLKNLEAKTGEKIKRHVQHYDKWFKPDTSGNETDYTNAAPQSETSFNVSVPSSTPGQKSKTLEIYGANSFKTSADDEKKEISITAGPNTVDLQGKKIHEKAGQLKGTVSQIFTGYYDKARKRWLSPQETKDFKEGKMGSANDIIAKPAVMFNIKKEEGDKGPGNALILDVNDVKGKYPKKGNQKKSFDDLISDLEVATETENKEGRLGTGWKQGLKTGPKTGAKGESTKTNNADNLRKKYNY